MNNEKYKKILVIIMILCFTIIPCYALFSNPYFITLGHDNVFHFSQIQDLYIAIKRDPLSTLISPSLNHGIGVGTRLMYGSLSHHLVVLLGLLIIPLGGNLMLAYKLVILFFYLFSNMIMYKLVYYLTKNRSLALIGVALFALFPYRFSNLYIRNAFSETIVISILPMIFYGLIKWLKEEFSISSYIYTGLGIVLVFHSHNISAIFTILFVLIFLGINYKKVYLSLKNNKHHRVFFVSTLASILLISFPFLTTLLESLTGDYRVFNNKVMGTNYEALAASYASLLSYVIYAFQTKWKLFLLFGSIFFLIPLITSYVLDKNKYRNIIFLCVYGISSLICALLLNSFYVIIAFFISLTIMYFISNETNYIVQKSVKKTLLILLLTSVALLVILPIWIILPSIFKNIQFIWRMWGFICIFVSILAPILLQRLLKNRQRYFSYVLSSSVGILIMVSYPLSINDSYFDSSNTINENISKNPNSTGWQLEYLPEIFFDSEYKDGSPLFIDIRNALSSSNDIEFIPYIYQGKANINNYNNSNNPNLKFDVECSEDSIIQLPLIYYKGYKITLTNEKGTKVLEETQIDGLLAFQINDSGQVRVDYTGSIIYQISRYTQTLTFISLLGILGYYIYQKNNCKKNKKKIQ